MIEQRMIATMKQIQVRDITIANDRPFVLFGGMNVLESRDLAMQVAESYVRATEKIGRASCRERV